MRLINTKTLKLENFNSSDIPKYAVFSHTWDKEEVTYIQLMDESDDIGPKQIGFGKIKAVCQLAAQHGLKYAWVDTCCIDSSSSSEVNESVNSMYDGFEDAEVCYVYLVDISSDLDIHLSRWFTRRWTLQELVAPREVKFHSRHWDFLGTKTTLADTIAQITGISPEFLRHERHLKSASVAERMSWAAKRS